MHKTKMGLSQQRSKLKIQTSVTPKKPKNKDKIVSPSPRSTRIHTLEAKSSPQIHKKTRNSSEL